MMLVEQIERIREMMIKAGQMLGYTAPETLALSQELDELLNEYMGEQ
jgi:hypothetical protein